MYFPDKFEERWLFMPKLRRNNELVHPDDVWEALLQTAGECGLIPDRLTTRIQSWGLVTFPHEQSSMGDFFKSDDLHDVIVINSRDKKEYK